VDSTKRTLKTTTEEQETGSDVIDGSLQEARDEGRGNGTRIRELSVKLEETENRETRTRGRGIEGRRIVEYNLRNRLNDEHALKDEGRGSRKRGTTHC